MKDFRLPFDEPIFHALNGLKSPLVDAVMVFASSREFGFACAGLLVLWVVGTLRRDALRPVLQFGLALLATDRFGHEVLKPWIGRIRPCYAMVQGTFRQLCEVGNAGSMPSLHSANAFAAAVAVTLAWPYAGWVLFPVATLIAVSRIFVGVHWPSDVLVGAAYGSVVALLLHLVVGRFVRARKPAAPVAER
ncbi:MAG: phosphatase PAP2 family protein [Archangiaceae bacterium]|nr:phosphatase PAP2 family protein [Archangiaceae bacterium]